MKRKREVVEIQKGSDIMSAIEELSLLVKLKPSSGENTKNDDHADAVPTAPAPAAADVITVIPTLPFLSLCNFIIEVLDKIGPTMAVLRHDVHQNIQRLEKEHESDHDSMMYANNLVEIIKKEVRDKNARKTMSCTRAFLWLTRSLDFVAVLLQKLVKEEDEDEDDDGGGPVMISMEQAVEDSYNITLKPWHGWISSAAFKVALKLVPDRKSFMNLLVPKDQDYDTVEQEIQTLISLLLPFLQAIHSTLRLYGLDRLKST